MFKQYIEIKSSEGQTLAGVELNSSGVKTLTDALHMAAEVARGFILVPQRPVTVEISITQVV